MIGFCGPQRRSCLPGGHDVLYVTAELSEADAGKFPLGYDPGVDRHREEHLSYGYRGVIRIDVVPDRPDQLGSLGGVQGD